MSQAEHPHPLVLTIATRGFLDRIAVLADSLKKHHPDVRLRCYLIESDATDADTCGDRFDVVPVGDLDLPARDHFLFQYTPFELCCALKPYCLLHALDGGAERALFLDGDMFVAQPFLTDLDAEWMNGILATPHLRTPDVETDFVYFLRTGHFNAGFLGARNTPEARSLLSWWAERVEKHCYRDYYGGILEDQRWLDMAIALFDGTDVLRHLGINVAHWNLHECEFSQNGECLMAAPGTPLCLFHFSTFQHPGLTGHEMVSPDIPQPIVELGAMYADLLASAVESCPPASPYSFGQFADGSEISPAMREAVRLGRLDTNINPFENPTAVAAVLPKDAPESIFETRTDYHVAASRAAAERLPRLEQELWEARNRLQRIEQHPVIGRLLRLWRRLANPNL